MAEEAKGDDRDHPAYCRKRKEIYEEICYNSEFSTLQTSVDNAQLLRDVDEVARLLRANLQACVESCPEDQVCECLSVCKEARSYIVNCKDARLHFVDTCTNTRNETNRVEGMIEKFAVLRLRELAQDFDTELGRLSLDIIHIWEQSQTHSVVVEDTRGILRSIREWKLSAVYAFLGRVHAPSSIEVEGGFDRSDETMMVDWQFSRVRKEKISIIGVSLNLGEYHELISACRFDRTVFTKVMRLLKCMHIIGLPLTPFDDATRLVTPKFGFVIKALKEMSKSELVWSFVRLPSSTSVLVQILLSQSLLNTSTAPNYKTSVTEMVKTLDWVLMYEEVINKIDAMSDHDKNLMCMIIRRSNTDQFAQTGLRPTWLVELITRGVYGKIFFAMYRRGGSSDHMTKLGEYSTTIDDYANDPGGLERRLDTVVMNNSSRGPNMSHGRTLLELRSESGGCKLIRGKIQVNMGEDKHVRITTSGQFDENVFKEIFLPIDETLADQRIQDSGAPVDEVDKSIRSLVLENHISFVYRSNLMFSKTPPISDDDTDRMRFVMLVYPRAYSTRSTFSLVDDIHWY